MATEAVQPGPYPLVRQMTSRRTRCSAAFAAQLVFAKYTIHGISDLGHAPAL